MRLAAGPRDSKRRNRCGRLPWMNRIVANPVVVRALRVAEEKLGLRDGQAVMPQHRFLRLVDLLTALDPAWDDDKAL